jgi:hypothetical protein
LNRNLNSRGAPTVIAFRLVKHIGTREPRLARRTTGLPHERRSERR